MKLGVLTGTRAEYGILRPLLKAFQARRWPFDLYVTGTHMSRQHGMTIAEITADGFDVAARIDIELDDDTPAAVTRSMGLALGKFGELLAQRRPDLLFILGDRYEALAVAAAAQVTGVPVAHLHGGEVTEGAIDEAFRHSITKMSRLHFTSTEEYRRRVIQLGESPESVFAVGALGLDNLSSVDSVEKQVLEDQLGFRFREINLLLTQHPLTIDYLRSEQDCAALVEALEAFPEAGVVLTSPNADPGGKAIADMLSAFAARHSDRAKLFTSLGTNLYFNVLRHVDAVIGNSSSGLIEAPSFGIPTINVGDRQKGRIAGPTVLSVPGQTSAIVEAVRQTLSPTFRAKIAGQPNPYGQGNAADAICGVVERLSFPLDLQKRFHDLG